MSATGYIGKDLRGKSFYGQNLQGEDFSCADIRGAVFDRANLRGANFSHVKAGLQPRWQAVTVISTTLLALLCGFLSGLTGMGVMLLLVPAIADRYSLLPVISVLILFAVIAVVTPWLGLEEAYSAAVVALIVAFIGLLTFPVTGFIGAFTALAIVLAVVLTASVAGSGVSAVTGIRAVFGERSGVIITIIAEVFAFLSVWIIPTIIAWVFPNITLPEMDVIELVSAAGIAMTGVGLSAYSGWQAIEENPKFAFLLNTAILLTSKLGTSFQQTDLTNANFSDSILENTNFTGAVVKRTQWFEARGLSKAKLDGTILKDSSVRELLVTRNGRNLSYRGVDLRGANLREVDLKSSDLSEVDLSEATLEEACLEDAILTKVQALGTNFNRASLTGACLEAWNIDHTTCLKEVECQYIFLLELPNKQGSRERRPHDPSQIFQPGDFEQLYQKAINVVQILLRNGINRQAFATAFQALMQENPEITFDSIQAIEKKGNDVSLTLEVPETTNKAKIEQDFLKPYEDRIQQLEAANTELKLRVADLKDIALALANKTVINQAVGHGTAMQENKDSSRKIEVGNIGRDFNPSGQALNLGEMDISGSVSNTIDQLPSSAESNKVGIKELLSQLQQAIETTTELSTGEKTILLEQVKALAEAQQTLEPERKTGLVQKAKEIIEAILKSLPTTATFVKACNDLLPMILKVLGFTT